MVIIKRQEGKHKRCLYQGYISIYVFGPHSIPGRVEGTPQTQTFMKQTFQDSCLERRLPTLCSSVLPAFYSSGLLLLLCSFA